MQRQTRVTSQRSTLEGQSAWDTFHPGDQLTRSYYRNCTIEPILFVDYDVPVSLHNGIPATTSTKIHINVHHQRYSDAPAADSLTFEVSADDGVTWTQVPTTSAGAGIFEATVTPIAGTGFLSLRAHASDPAGSIADQTVIRAVQVTPAS